MTTAIDQRNAGLFSAAAYAPVDSITDIDTQQVINMGWRLATTTDGTPISVDGPPDSNTRLRVFVNDDTRQVVMAFKGSDSIADFKSDILNSGFDQYENIRIAANGALRQINETYAGYNVLVDGHSLGGGMAQSFALENRLNGFAQNSLPVAAGTIDTYFTEQGIDINDAVSTYQAEHVFVSVNVSGDIATLKYSTVEHQLYISTETITLASPYVALELAGTATSPMGLALFGYASAKAHLLTTLNPLASEQVEAGDGAALPGSVANLLDDINSLTANQDGSYTITSANGSVFKITETLSNNNNVLVNVGSTTITPTGEIGMFNTYDLTTGNRISTTRAIVDGETSTEITIDNDGTVTKTVINLADSSTITKEIQNIKPISSGEATKLVVSDVASFITSLRNGDEVTQIISAARLVYDIAAINQIQGLDALGNSAYGAGSIVGIIGAIKGLQSDNVLTQLGSATSLLSNASTLYDVFDGGYTVGSPNGFFDSNSLNLLNQVGAIISVANLATNLDDLLQNGQVIPAINSIVSTYQSVAVAFQWASFNPYVFAITTIISLFGGDLFGGGAEEPPPAPPVGEAVFTHDANGNLSYHISNPFAGKEAYVDYGLGYNILRSMLEGPDGLVAKLNSQLSAANTGNTDPDRALTLIASRMPKITIQSWMIDSEADNGKDNYFYILETKDPRTGEKQLNALANEDIVRHFAETLIYPEAIAQQWEVNNLKAKFGLDEANWKTEGQWSTARSTIEQERTPLEQAVEQAKQALEQAKTNDLTITDTWKTTGLQGNVKQTPATELAAAKAAKEAAIAQAQTTLDNAQQALDLYNVQHPSDPQLAARIVDENALPHIDSHSSKEAIADYITQRQVAIEGASHQWLKVIALDLSTAGDGISQRILPNNVKQDLRSIQTDGVARFDVDNDGYREATQWINPTDAVLGLDRDGNGRIDSANELFNGINTPFDQRGAASLQYYDDNNDGKLNAQDKVFKLLRLWIDLDGDGSAGDLEVFNMDMRLSGDGAASLIAAMNASGLAALDALAQQAVQSINLSTLQFQLKDGTTNQGSEVQLKSEVEGITLLVDDATQNISILHENAPRENYITLVADMEALLEWTNPNLTAARKNELKNIANKYGLNTDSPEFMTVVRNLRVGGENIGSSGMPVYISSGDVFVDNNARQRIEAMRFSFQAVVDARSADIANIAYLGQQSWVESNRESLGFDDGWNAAHGAVVVSDTPAPETPRPPRSERWVLPSDVYSLDYVVKGLQLGGLIVQKAVLASNADQPTAPKQLVQVFTTAKPNGTLATATLQGGEDGQFSFGFAQLEQEAKTLIAGSTPYTIIKLLGVRDATHGTIVIDDATGTINFIADENYSGTAAGFSYVVADDQGRILVRRINFNLVEINDAPTVLGEHISAKEDVPLTIDVAALLANDSDLEHDRLSIIGIGRVGMGKAELLPNGQIHYTPPSDLYGTTDTVEYIVQDARGGSAIGVIKITLEAVNDAPTVVSEIIRNAQEDTNLRIDPSLLLANDFDPDFNFLAGAEPLHITAVGNAQHGHVFLDASGHIIFVPDEDFNGIAKFEYTVADITGLETTGQAEVDINAVNDAPRAFGETIHSVEDQKLIIDPDLLLANDTDTDILRGEKQTLNIIAVDEAQHGSVAIKNGNVIFTPDENYHGDASFRYTVGDGNSGFAQATVHLDISAVNDAPQAINRAFIGSEDTAITITYAQLLAGIVDIDNSAAELHISNVQNALGGTLTQNSSGITFTPKANMFGNAQFQYSVSDTQGASSTATVFVDFNNVNDAPVFVAGSHFVKSGEEDQEVRISGSALLNMFADADKLAGDTLAIDLPSLSTVNSADSIRYDATTQEIVFKTAANANGVREFNLRAVDKAGALSNTVTLQVDIRALNDAPIVKAAGFQVLEDGGYTDPTKSATSYLYHNLLLQNASDADGDTLTIISVGNGKTADGRSVTVVNDNTQGRIAIQTPLNYNGAISFEFKVNDGHGGTTSQTAYGNVVAVNDTPQITAVYLGKHAQQTVNKSFWGDVTISSDMSREYYRLDITDVEDGSGLSPTVDHYPLQSVVHQGETWGTAHYSYQSGNGPSGYFYANNTTTVSYQTIVKASANYFGIENQIVRGTTQQESVVFKVTDLQGAVGYQTVTFQAYGYDPIVIDLGNNGLEFITAADSQVLLDRDGDGLKEHVAWVKPTEAILAWDHNHDNKINRTDEIEFASHVNPLIEGITDLQVLGLPEFDGNQDGKFDSADSKWSEFKLWQDLNSNGVSDPGELKTLSEAGIKALYLNANVLNRHYGPDVLVRGYTRIEMMDGTFLQAGDVKFNILPSDWVAPDTTPTSSQQQATTASAEENQALLSAQQRQQTAAREGDSHFSGALQDQKVLTGETYEYILPENMFTSLWAGALYKLTQASGAALPTWLHFDSATHTLYGTPTKGQLGTWQIKVSGYQNDGDIHNLTSAGQFSLSVAEFNQAPTAYGTVPTQYANEGSAFSLEIAPNFFIDNDTGDKLNYAVTLANGEALPSWLNFDTRSLRLFGTPDDADVGALDIIITAKDTANATAQSHFELVIEAVNDAPVLHNPVATIQMLIGQANTFTLPQDIFIDTDLGDSLSLEVKPTNSAALPDWLIFDAATLTLSATPTQAQLASPLQLQVIATDLSGAKTSTLITLTAAVWGTNANDTLTGSQASETLWGLGGNDTLTGNAGADRLIGGTGDDTYIADNYDTIIEKEGEGIDTVQADRNWALVDNLENLVLIGTSAINGTGNTLNNLIIGNAAANTLNGGTGADTMIGGLGNDIYVVDHAGDIVTETSTLASEIDNVQSSVTYTLGSNVENLSLTSTDAINGTGNELNNTLIGNAANNTLSGGAGNDILNGGTGADTMIGGTGNDTYVVDSNADVVTETSTLATEIDTVQSSITYILGSNVENLTLTGAAAINATGNELNNSITGNAASNTLTGGTGNDILNGANGNDTYLFGRGYGRDTVYDSDATVGNLDIVQMAADLLPTDIVVNRDASHLYLKIEGTDDQLTLASWFMSDAQKIEQVKFADGTIWNVATLTAKSNLGTTGNDYLIGTTGADTLVAGLGNDIYIVNHSGDIISENLNEGTDTVQASVTYTLAANIENLTLTGSDAINGTGNDLSNIITGNAASNTLNGGAGNDQLNGGTGVDNLLGGLGNDTYYVDNTGDIVTENLNEGTDTVYSNISYTLSADIENLYLTGGALVNATGNTLNNVLYGHANTAVNTLTGGLGNDVYYAGVGDIALESVDEGIDSVYSYTNSYTLGANLENLYLNVTTAATLIGNELNNSISGNAGNDTLDGGIGNDILNGGAGADIMIGGLGNDTYVIDNSGDVVTETSTLATEIDTVQSGVTYTLGSNLENLMLTGTAAINGTGNELNNTLIGNVANNTLNGGVGNDALNGGAGADSLLGGLGNDTYYVDNAGDVITENLNEGTDTVYSNISYALGAEIENLYLTGTAAINATGNTLNNVLYGHANSAVNTLRGGLGNDTYYTDAGDIILESVDAGIDSIYTYASSYTLRANVEHLYLNAMTAATLIGNELSNSISGNVGNDTLDGGAGNDVLNGLTGADIMIGGLGNDTYVVDNSGDVVTETSTLATEIDTVQSNITYTLGSNVENLTLTGTDAINGTGNELNNTLIGNAANNTINGGAGNDTMAGGTGDDIYIVDVLTDVITENINSGTDTVQTGITYTLGSNVENLVLTGAIAINGTGNELSNTLTGNAANNILTGNAGNDTLDGDIGTDTLVGGADNDTYIVDLTSTNALQDTITEAALGGVDTLRLRGGATLTTATTFSLLGTELEHLDSSATGSTLLNLIGNAYDNTLTGNAAANILNGGFGADSLIGGAGNDTYIIDNAADVITEAAGEGIDHVQSGISTTLGANVENLTLINGTTYVSARVGQTNMNGMFGLNSDPSTDSNYTSLDYAWHPTPSGLYIYESGAQVGYFGTYTTSDIFAVAYDGKSIHYLKNGVEIRSVATAEGRDFYFDSSLYETGFKFTDVQTGSGVLTAGNTNVSINGTTITKVAGGSGWGNADAYSVASPLTATGNELENVLTGNNAANTLTGNAGNDTLDGGLGADTLIGGTGNDTYIIDNTNDVVTENANEGIDLVRSSLVSTTLDNNLENLTLIDNTTTTVSARAAQTNMYGMFGLNSDPSTDSNYTSLDYAWYAYANGTLHIYESGAYIGSYGAYSTTDLLTVAYDGNSVSYLKNGVVQRTVTAGTGRSFYFDSSLHNDGFSFKDVQAGTGTLTSSSSNISINGNVITKTGGGAAWNEAAYSASNLALNGSGNALDNIMTGNTLGNRLDGGAGADTLNGGTGNDTYIIDNLGDIIIETSTLASEVDSVQSAVTWTLGANLEHLTLTGSAAINGTGNALNNTITGNTANNILDGGLGADILIGGAGDDTYIVDLTSTNTLQDTITEAALGGVDTLRLRGGAALATFTTLTLGTGIDNLDASGTGSTLLDLMGNELNNVLIGNTESNKLNGGIGADTMIGGAGHDTYTVDNVADVINENVNEGADLVSIAIATADGTYTLGANVEDGTLTNTVAFSLTGNASNNTLTGNAAANTLTGGAGNDVLNGLGGNDTLIGGLGDDTYTIDVLTDVITENADEGTDLVNVAIATAGGTYTLAANVEDGTLTNTVAFSLTGNASNNTLTGNAAANTLTGGAGNDILNGLGGNDTLIGGLGDDTYTIDVLTDVITENADEGTDLVNVAIATAGGNYTLAANVENATLTNTVAYNLTGNALNNTLTGNTANNTLVGGAGNDILNGLGGNDTMLGGTEDDLYIVDAVADIVTELNNEGIDTVQTSITYSLVDTDGAGTNGANVENLTLTGFAAINGTGNALNNTLIGNSAINTLDGGAGNDVLNGGAGDDQYLFSSNGGLDQVLDSSGNDKIVFGTGVTAAQITASRANGEVTLTVSSGNSIRFADLGSNTYAVEQFQFADGSVQNALWVTTLLNTPPSGTDKTITTSEDSAYTLNATDFGFTDVDMGDSLSAVRIASLSTAGSLKLNGLVVTVGQEIAAANIGNLVFTPTANANGVNYANFTFSVKDQYGAFDTTPNTLNFNVTAVNDAPTLNAPLSLSYTDTVNDDAFVTKTGNLVAADVDIGTTLSYGISGGTDNGTTVSQVSTYGTLTVTKASGAYTFVPNDTAIEALKTNTSASYTVTVTDGVIATPVASTLTINLTGANDTAVFSGNLSGNVTEDGTQIATGTLTATDRDPGDAAITAQTNTAGSYGNFSIASNGQWTYTLNNAASNVQSLKAGQSVTDTFTVNTAGGTSQSISLSVTGTNDAPILSTAKATLVNGSEDTAYTITQVSLLTGFSDVDGNPLTVTGLTATNGTLSAFNTTTQSWVFTPTANFNGTVNLNYTVTDGIANTAPTRSFNLAAVNDAPIGNVSISGTPIKDQTLIADTSLITDNDGLGQFKYQWQNSTDGNTWSNISGANSATYYLTDISTGKKVRLQTSYLDGNGYLENVNSNSLNIGNSLIGTANGDSLNGTAYADRIEGLAGNDNLYGYAGNDTYVFGRGYGADYIHEYDSTAGNIDTIQMLSDLLPGDVIVNRDVNHLYLKIAGTSDQLTLANWFINDGYKIEQVKFADGTIWEVATLTAKSNLGTTGNDYLAGTTGAETLAGSLGNDTYIVNHSSDIITENLNEGTDSVQASVTYTLAANVENLFLTGATAISGTGNQLNNMITGNAANNTLTGGAGDDVLDVSTTDVIIIFSSVDSTTSTSSVRYFINGEMIANTAISNGMLPTLKAEQSAVITGSSSIDMVYVAPGSTVDAINLSGGADRIYLTGKLNDYQITTTGGNLIFDRIAGLSAGQTERIITASGAAAAGRDEIYFADGYTTTVAIRSSLSTNTSIVLDSSKSTSIFDLSLLPIGAGADTLIGGTDNDTYVVDNSGDIVTENLNEGTDTVQSYLANYALTANVDNLDLMGYSNTNGNGNSLSNRITGNAANNILNGGAGNDLLIGGAGDDVLDGVVTTDLVRFYSVTGLSGNGSGLYYVNNQFAATVSITNGILPTFKIGQSVNYIGSAADDSIYVAPGSSADASDLGTGNDRVYLTGKLADYTQTIDQQIGIYTLTRTSGLAAGQVETVTITSSFDADRLYFADGYVIMQWDFVQTDGTTLWSENSGNSVLRMMRQTDLNISEKTPASFDLSLLPISEGADTLIGGAGNDTYVVDNSGDAVTEYLNEGTDTVQSYLANYTLAANVENLTLMGYSNTNGTGNILNNTITGNAANNILDGGAGSDILIGGSAADIFRFSSPLSATDIDTVSDFASGTDKIGLSTAIFTKLLNDTDLSDNIVVSAVGSNALDANDYLLYNTTTKALYYDADGSGAGAAVQFATLTNIATVRASDFVVM